MSNLYLDVADSFSKILSLRGQQEIEKPSKIEKQEIVKPFLEASLKHFAQTTELKDEVESKVSLLGTFKSDKKSGLIKDDNSVFDYEKLECEEEYESECLSVYLKVKKLSDTERNELLASLLMQGFKSVCICLKGEKYGKTYDLRDIDMPFFLPVYFEDQSGENTACMDNLETMFRIVYEKALQDKWLSNLFLHEVEAGETLYGIAKRYEITQEDILKYNPGLQDSPLKVGQVITINLNGKYTKNTPKTVSGTPKKENKNILIYLFFGLSVLLNAWFIWRFYAKKKDFN